MTAAAAPIEAVLAAAGSGTRMGLDTPKQYLVLGALTVLEHSVAALRKCRRIGRIVIALPPDDEFFATLPLSRDPGIITVTGGASRAQSVLNALEAVTSADVLVHDCARPCVASRDIDELIARCAGTAEGGILCAPVAATLKKADPADPGRIACTVSRQGMYEALTPQLFNTAKLRATLKDGLSQNLTLTDEASAFEAQGIHPQLVVARHPNPKLTTPADTALITWLLSTGKAEKTEAE